MTEKIAVTVYLHRAEFQALSRIAADRGTQSPRLIEGLVSRALRPKPVRVAKAPKEPKAPLDEGRVFELHGQGLDDGKIAAEMGVERDRVRYVRMCLGLPATVHGRPSNVDPDEVRRLHAEGLRDREIGAAIGLTANAILNVRRRLGLPANYTPGGRRVSPTKGTDDV